MKKRFIRAESRRHLRRLFFWAGTRWTIVGGVVMRVSIVGAGRTGRTLGRLLAAAGFSIGAVTCRTLDRGREAVRFIGEGVPGVGAAGVGPGDDVLLICVPDGAIRGVADALPAWPGLVVAHTAGALGVEVLEGAASKGADVGTLHPLRSFADPARAAASFSGTACAVEGGARAVEVLTAIARRIGGRPLRIGAGGKAPYHAGAVFASNYVVAVFEAARRLFEEAGVAPGEGAEALAELMEGTLANLRASGPRGAMTGPIERGDVDTVIRHLRAMRRVAPELLVAYAALGRIAADVARAKGSLDEPAVERVLEALGAVLPPEPASRQETDSG